MKKHVEDLQMSINEKDAEIIKLNMHLGDEKKRYQNLMRIQHSSQKSLLAHNASTQSLLVRPQKEQMVGSGDAGGTAGLTVRAPVRSCRRLSPGPRSCAGPARNVAQTRTQGGHVDPA